MTVVAFTRRTRGAMELATGTGCNGAVMQAAEAMAWAERAQAGDELVYAIGHLPSWSATPKRLYKLFEQGLVALTTDHSKAPKEYVAQRTAKPWQAEPAPPPRIARQIAPSADDMARLLKVVQAEARGGQPCSTNHALAIKAGLRDGDRVSYLLKKLVRAGSIRNEASEWWPGRQMTDLSTGKQTLLKVGLFYARLSPKAKRGRR